MSEEKVKYLDDDTSEDSDVPSNDRKPAAGYNEVKLPLERFDSQAKHYRLLDVHVKNLSHSTRNSSPETASKKTGQKKVVHGEKGSAVLKLDELNFKPNCDIVTKEAVSAINRAKSQHCKQEIANLTCLTYSNKLYASRLPRYCPSKGNRMPP